MITVKQLIEKLQEYPSDTLVDALNEMSIGYGHDHGCSFEPIDLEYDLVFFEMKDGRKVLQIGQDT
ncbi:MAG: hypothetical protein D4S01_11450 [Dehalococcoidia bacterium]|nr:MAG: hypothetical protein D4S01_11450 [Dehalococcoidia bacterium]